MHTYREVTCRYLNVTFIPYVSCVNTYSIAYRVCIVYLDGRYLIYRFDKKTLVYINIYILYTKVYLNISTVYIYNHKLVIIYR